MQHYNKLINLTVPPVARCMIPFFLLVEIAFFKSTTASLSSLGVRDGVHLCTSKASAFTSLLQLTQCTRISANNRYQV